MFSKFLAVFGGLHIFGGLLFVILVFFCVFFHAVCWATDMFARVLMLLLSVCSVFVMFLLIFDSF